jgi:PAS domain S-box-containing protein
VTKAGEERWMSSSGFPVYADGKFSGILGVFFDITEQKQRG